MNTRYCLFMLMGFMLISACSHDDKKTAAPPAAAEKPALMDPFRYHKMVEVAPGDDFDILSWGRGSSAVGSFLILHSDSADMKYTTTTGDLEGTIVDVYNSDMDLDGNPEILIQAKATDTASYAIIYAYEFTNNKAQKLDFPKLTASQRKGYRGGDNFYIQDGKFMREFPIYDGNSKEARPTGQKRLLQYGLKNNEFTVQQISKDSVSATKPIVKTPATAGKSTVKKQTSYSSKKKKHKAEQPASHHKKKKHHRHSDGD